MAIKARTPMITPAYEEGILVDKAVLFDGEIAVPAAALDVCGGCVESVGAVIARKDRLLNLVLTLQIKYINGDVSSALVTWYNVIQTDHVAPLSAVSINSRLIIEEGSLP